MDAANIEMTLIMATMHCSNDTMLAACRRHPGRLVGGVYADPREGTNGIETVRRYHAQGVRIVKLFPNIGYFPDDPALHGFFDAVADLGMLVLSHCGWLGGSGKGMNREDWGRFTTQRPAALKRSCAATPTHRSSSPIWAASRDY